MFIIGKWYDITYLLRTVTAFPPNFCEVSGKIKVVWQFFFFCLFEILMVFYDSKNKNPTFYLPRALMTVKEEKRNFPPPWPSDFKIRYVLYWYYFTVLQTTQPLKFSKKKITVQRSRKKYVKFYRSYVCA